MSRLNSLELKPKFGNLSHVIGFQREVCCKKTVLKNFAKFTGKLSLFLNKASGCKLAAGIKKVETAFVISYTVI